MGIVGEHSHVATALPDYTFDRDARLPLVEDDPLVIEDSLAITHMHVHANRRRAPSRIAVCNSQTTEAPRPTRCSYWMASPNTCVPSRRDHGAARLNRKFTTVVRLMLRKLVA